MATSKQSITKAQFSAIFSLGGVMPFSGNIPLSLPLSFDDVQNVVLKNGSYTSNNDYLYLMQSIPPALAPNFLILLCDSQCSLTMTFPKNSASCSYQRFAFLSWVPDPSNLISGIFIDGRINPNPGVSTMPQGVACNYTIITGQAVIS